MGGPRGEKTKRIPWPNQSEMGSPTKRSGWLESWRRNAPKRSDWKRRKECSRRRTARRSSGSKKSTEPRTARIRCAANLRPDHLARREGVYRGSGAMLSINCEHWGRFMNDENERAVFAKK